MQDEFEFYPQFECTKDFKSGYGTVFVFFTAPAIPYVYLWVAGRVEEKMQ